MTDRPFKGTPHFTEIAYVFYNLNGLGYPTIINPFTNATQALLDLAKLTNRMWISFIHDLDPNNHGSTYHTPFASS
jgi:carboxylesterase type B